MMEEFLVGVNQKIHQALEHLKHELSSIRAGRANPTLIENISVPAYGASMKLVELGTISAPQPSLLTVQVWDISLVDAVFKAIQEAKLGLNPANDGQLIRVPIPPLTSERREEFIKLSHTKMEQARVSIRQIRQEFREEWEKEKEAGEFGEDELLRREKILQEVVDRAVDQIENIGRDKEEELSQV